MSVSTLSAKRPTSAPRLAALPVPTRQEAIVLDEETRLIANFTWAEFRRRGVLPENYSFAAFCRDAIFERAHVLAEVVVGIDPEFGDVGNRATWAAGPDEAHLLVLSVAG